MDGIREYLIGVVAAALLCGIITTLTDSKGTVGAAVKLISGLLLLLAVIRPWASISFEDLFDWADDIAADGTGFAVSGEKMAGEAYRAGIKKQTEAYIVDEAKALGCELTVEVRLSENEIPVPIQVSLSGQASPYARQTLINLMTEKLGLGREDLIWT